MAGAGWRQWTRERLSQTLLQTFIQDQVVMRFTSASQRATLLPNPTEGMVSTLDDTDQVMRHNGSTWVDVRAQSLTTFGIAIQQLVNPGGTYAMPLLSVPNPYQGAYLDAELSVSVRFLASSQQTLGVNQGLVGATFDQNDFDITDRIPGASGGGETVYNLRRRSVVQTTVAAGAAVQFGHTFVLGTGGSSVYVQNPRLYVRGPHRLV